MTEMSIKLSVTYPAHLDLSLLAWRAATALLTAATCTVTYFVAVGVLP